MKIFVITKGERIKTISRLMKERIAFTIITHNQRCLDSLQKLLNGRPLGSVIITNKKGCLSSRNALLDLVDKNEWYCSMDDDLGEATQVCPEYYDTHKLPVYGAAPRGFTNWREVYRYSISYTQVFKHLRQLAKTCDDMGASLGGLATLENPYFRANHFAHYKNVTTALHIAKKRNLKKIKGGEYAHDQWQTAYKMATDGCVLINNFVRVDHKAFANPTTGLGDKEYRRAKLEPALKSILKEFKGLVRDAGYPNIHYALRSQATIDTWRKEHGYL